MDAGRWLMPDIKKLIAKNLGKQKDLGVKTATLTKVTPGTRTAGALSAGNNPTTTDYTCKAFKSAKRSGYWQFWQNAQAGTMSRTKFLTISILGGTLPSGVEPMAGDRIAFEGVTYTIEPTGVSSDPVGAVFECVVRAPGG